jgi:hypothetical protein
LLLNQDEWAPIAPGGRRSGDLLLNQDEWAVIAPGGRRSGACCSIKMNGR